MEISFYKGDLETPAEVSVAPTAIRDAVTDTVAPESEGADEPVLTAPFVSPARNGRLPVPAGRSVWEIESTVPLRDAFPAEALLYAKGRILVQQKEAWELRDESGATLAQGARDPGAVFLDVENGRFYVNDPTGFLKAHDLDTGAVQFLLYPLFGRGYVRSVLQARGDRIAFVGTELPVMSHRETRPPAYTIMELHDVAPPIQVDDEKVIRSNRLIESLVARPVPLIAVARGNGLALAAPDHLFFVNEDLRIEADLQESFTPITLSADDAGRVYVVVSTQSEDGPAVTSLWG
ncbi:MAG TPA: hypothetical protein VF190_08685, partial [Rhodothermales bacterium]